MARLNCNDPAIEAALDDVRSDETDTNWYIAVYYLLRALTLTVGRILATCPKQTN